MSRIRLIISREYFTRVKKKSFLIMTFLTPLIFAGMMSLIVFLSVTQKDDSEKQIVVVDDTHKYENVLQNQDNVTFITVPLSIEDAKEQLEKHFALLHIHNDLVENPGALKIYSKKQVNIEIKQMITRQLNEHIEQQKIAAYPDINLTDILKELETNVRMEVVKVGKDGKEKKTSFELVMALGFFTGFMIYITILIYGTQVMRGIIEEKTGRIVEIIVSSVKPFELMMGKIIGIAMVGLTQFFMWIILSFIIYGIFGVTTFAGLGEAAEVSGSANADVVKVFEMLQSLNGMQIAVFFIIYFLGGYLLYAAMFAAVGGAVDNETDTQQFMMPITLPMIFAFYVGISVMNNPHGPLAVWCSMIPFTSPVVMMIRIPFEVPLWQVLLSISILIMSFIGMTYLAAKIYRTGILIYGKKVNYRELWKWIKYS